MGTNRLVVLALLGAVLGYLPALGQPQADYGDAPDSYETRFASGGPYHTTVTDEWMAWPITQNTTTTTEPDALLVNGDADDAHPFVLIFPIMTPWPGGWLFRWTSRWFFPVRIHASAPDTVRYLNVFADRDRDGTFWDADSADWIVRQRRVQHPPGQTVCYESDVGVPFPNWTWLRAILSRDTLEWEDFPSTGTFGETEDHFVDITLVDTCRRKKVYPSAPWNVRVPRYAPRFFLIKIANKSCRDVWFRGWAPPVVLCPVPVTLTWLGAPGWIPRGGAIWDLWRVNWTAPPPTGRLECTALFSPIHCWGPFGDDPLDSLQCYGSEVEVKFGWNDSVNTDIAWPDSLDPWVMEGENLSFTIQASCSLRADTAFLRALSLPPGAMFDPVSGRLPLHNEFSWTPTFEQTGEYVAEFETQVHYLGEDDRPVVSTDTLKVKVIGRHRYAYPIVMAARQLDSVAAGDTATVTFRVSNMGDTADSYSCMLSDSLGWEIEQTAFNFPLDWLWDSIVTGRVVVPSGTPRGTENVISLSAVSDGDGRLRFADTTRLVVEPTGVLEPPAETPRQGLEVFVFPIARRQAVVSYAGVTPGPASVEIRRATGEVELRREFSARRSGRITLDLRELSAGVYLVRFEAGEHSVSRKLTLMR